MIEPLPDQPSQFGNLLLLILKYAGSVTAGAYGIYATLTDFKEHHGDRQVLSRKGRIGIAVLLCSILLNISADGAKDYNERKEADAARAEKQAAWNQERATLQTTLSVSNQLAQARDELDQTRAELTQTRDELNQTAATSRSVLDVSQRAADAFSTTDESQVLIYMRIPTDQKIIGDRGPVIAANEVYFGQGCSLTALRSAQGSNLSALIFDTRPLITFSRSGDDPLIADDTVHLDENPATRFCENEGSPDFSLLGPLPPSDGAQAFLQWNRDMLKPIWTDNAGKFRSYLDFDKAHVSILFEYASSHSFDATTSALRYDVQFIKIRTTHGREIQATDFHNCEGKTGYYHLCGVARLY
jgi:hypothetical protein